MTLQLIVMWSSSDIHMLHLSLKRCHSSWGYLQRSAKRRGCLLSYSQAEPGGELTQPSPRLLAEPCMTLSSNILTLRIFTQYLPHFTFTFINPSRSSRLHPPSSSCSSHTSDRACTVWVAQGSSLQYCFLIDSPKTGTPSILGLLSNRPGWGLHAPIT